MKPNRAELLQSGYGGRAQTPRRKKLHRYFERALAETKLPERPDYEAANRFLIKARRTAGNGSILADTRS